MIWIQGGQLRYRLYWIRRIEIRNTGYYKVGTGTVLSAGKEQVPVRVRRNGTYEMWCGTGNFKIWVYMFRVTVTPKSHLEKHSVFQGVPGSSFHGGVSRHFYST